MHPKELSPLSGYRAVGIRRCSTVQLEPELGRRLLNYLNLNLTDLHISLQSLPKCYSIISRKYVDDD
jgi:hypothetical protein